MMLVQDNLSFSAARGVLCGLHDQFPPCAQVKLGRVIKGAIIDGLDALFARLGGSPYRSLITFATDRPGHDRRYAVDCSKIEAETGWTPSRRLEEGLEETIRGCPGDEDWWRPIRAKTYAGRRLGTGSNKT